MKDYKSLSSTTQERIRDLLRPVLGEVDDPKAAQMSQAELSLGVLEIRPEKPRYYRRIF